MVKLKKKATKQELKEDKFLIFVDNAIKGYIQHKIKINIISVIILCLIGTAAISIAYKHARLKKINNMYLNAITRNDLHVIVDEYPRMEASALAYFLIGTKLYDEKKYDEAADYYKMFIDNYPNHYLTPFVYVDIGYCFENLGNIDDALRFYLLSDEMFPETGVALQGNINAARCYVSKENLDSAKKLYNKVIKKAPFSLWAEEAKQNLTRILHEQRK